MMIDVIFGTPKELSEAMVIVDVFRSSTTIVTALDNGARYVVPCRSVEEARRFKSEVEGRLRSALLIGEDMGITPEGFDLNISPQNMRKEFVQGKVLIYRSTNLTSILHSCQTAKMVLIGALVNATAVARHLEAMKPRNVGIVACGMVPYEMVTLEDVVGAGAIVHDLRRGKLSDSAMLSRLVYHNSKWRKKIHNGYIAKYLTKIGFSEDILYCLQENISDTVPVLKNGRLSEAVKP